MPYLLSQFHFYKALHVIGGLKTPAEKEGFMSLHKVPPSLKVGKKEYRGCVYKLGFTDTLFLLIIRQSQNTGDTYYIMKIVLHALKWMDILLRK